MVRLLKRGAMPMIAFITAYDEYAVRAFEMNAVDYLLKPVDAARLRETVSRAIDGSIAMMPEPGSKRMSAPRRARSKRQAPVRSGASRSAAGTRSCSSR